MSSSDSDDLSPLLQLLGCGPSSATVPLAFESRDPVTQPSDGDSIALYPIGVQERLRKRREQLINKGVTPAEIQLRLAQMAASIGGASAASEAHLRAAQSTRSQEAYASTVVASPNSADDSAVINFLNTHGPSKALAIAKATIGPEAVKAQVNPLLHRMKHLGMLAQSNNKIWSLADESVLARVSLLMRNSPPRNAMEIAGLLGLRHADVATVLTDMILGKYGHAGQCLYASEHNTPSGRHTYYRSRV